MGGALFGTRKRFFILIATGEEIPHLAVYVDTLFTDHGLVWHVFEQGGVA